MIDEATIKRVAGECGAEAWWVSGNEDSVEFYAVLHQFARDIEQLARQEQREEDAQICERRYMGDNNREDMEARRCAEAIRASGKEK